MAAKKSRASARLAISNRVRLERELKRLLAAYTKTSPTPSPQRRIIE